MAPKHPSIVLIDGDDWSAVYVDGILHEQGHLDLEGVELGLSAAQAPFSSFEANADWLQEQGRFPKLLTEVVIDAPEAIPSSTLTEV